MVTPNFPNRTLAVMDNLEFLRALDNECIDLIAIDPPFAANETFEGKVKPTITDAERRAEFTLAASHGEEALERYRKEDKQLTRVKDDWFWRDIDPAWLKALRDVGERIKAWDDCPEDERNSEDQPTARDRTLDAMREVIEAVSACATENEAAYIAMMGVRLLECRRVLKDTGSIYVHCDHHANSYIRMTLDVIFGKKNFRNEISWQKYAGRKNNAKNKFNTRHETILFYSKSAESSFNVTYEPLSDSALKEYRHTDENGRLYRMARRGKGYESTGGERRIYLDENPGNPIGTLWIGSDLTLPQSSNERTGYATQKPLKLLDRIIRASSNPGDVVMDLFAGCSTTALAAENAGRKWIACDMAYRATTMNYRRFYKEAGILLSTANLDVVRGAVGEHQIKADDGEELTTKYKHGTLVGPNDLHLFPRQTVDPAAAAPNLRTIPKRAPISTSWTGGIPKPRAKELLLAEFGPYCWGCGMSAMRPNGTVDEGLLEVDHMQARNARDGVKGDDELYNLALLHGSCNRWKGNHLTLAELREENWAKGRMCVEHVEQRDAQGLRLLPHLYEAQQFAVKEMLKAGVQADAFAV